MFFANWRPWRPILVALGMFVLLMSVATRSQAVNYETSWLGNSFPGTPNQLHVQDDILGMYVASDGTCYANSTWDEGGTEAAFYKNNAVAGSCGSLHGWGRGGGQAIAADANYVYVGMMQSGDDGANTSNNRNGLAQYPAPNTMWYCVRRYTRAGASAPFSTGYGYDGSMLIVNTSTRPNSNVAYTGLSVSGITVDANYLYVCDPNANQIKKYSLSTLSGTPVASWSLTSPGPMVLDNGILSVIQNGATPKILQYTTSGSLQSTITFASGDVPSGMAYNSANNYLLVTDAGPDQDVKEYNLGSLGGSPTTIASVFGTVGGIYAGTGAQIGTTGALRFNNPTGVGVDSSGNIYVSQDGAAQEGGTVLESYTSGGSRNWQLSGLEFVDCADIDPSSENDVFTKEEHFVMNYGNTTPGTEASYQGYTINRFKYPQDPRSHLGELLEAAPWVRRYQGQKFLVTTDMYSNFLVISRFNSATDGECAIPSTVFAQQYHTPDSTGWPENEPASGEWIWRDSNGNGAFDSGEYAQTAAKGNAPSTWGWWVDSNMDVWAASQTGGIRHFACQGLDSHGNPIYDYNHVTTIAMPSQFNDVERVEYYPATDTMYLTGYSAAQPNTNNDWKIIGKVICRYDNWSTSPSLHVGYPILPQFSDTSSPTVQPAGMSATGPYLFVTYVAQNQIVIYNSDTGAQVGTIIPGSSIGGSGSNNTNIIGWNDIPYGVRAYERSNGEYEIFNEDDWLGKVVLYRWTPELQIENRWQSTYINTQNGLQCTTINGAWWSADWVEEPVAGGMFRLRNLWTAQYLNIQNGSLQCTTIQPTWTSAMWTLGDVDGTYNYLTNTYANEGINTQNGLECTTINGGWWSAMWQLTEVN